MSALLRPEPLRAARPAPAAAPLLRSFWMAGFEGSDHINVHGQPLDFVELTGHADEIEGDYARLVARGLRVARESIGWRHAEPAGKGRFDFGRALTMARAAERHSVQILWTLMHYGTPADVSLLDDAFIERFADYAAAAARALRPWQSEAPIYSPINEISFLAWAACETNLIHPYVGDRRDPRHRPMPNGFEVKRRLVAATLRAMAAIRAEDPRARFLHIDPLVHVVAPAGADAALIDEARRFREFQWQAWDMLCGRAEPELGGTPPALDLIGVNHYVTAQWEFATGRTLGWPGDDPQRLPFGALLREAWLRYRRPLVVSETGHVGADRAAWLDAIDREVRRSQRDGTEVLGVCLYPIIDRPDWNDLGHWHRSGLWDAAPSSADGAHAVAGGATAPPGRHLDVPFAAALARCQAARPPFSPSRSTAS